MISVVLAAELPITDDINAIAARLVATLAARLGTSRATAPTGV
jgi:hypothetical protein